MVENLPAISLFVVTAVAALVDLVDRAFNRDWRGVIKISGAGLIGGLAGAFAIDGLTFATGVVAGLSASGAITILKRNGQGQA